MDAAKLAPEAPHPQSHPQSSNHPDGDDGKGDSDRKKPVVRKRTKTGCLSMYIVLPLAASCSSSSFVLLASPVHIQGVICTQHSLLTITSQACRKRRIKCDESKPICNNCIKSKRHCEGYNQRVVFKDPIGAFHVGGNGPAVYPPGSSHHSFPRFGNSQSKSSSQAPPLAAIAPKPPTAADYPRAAFAQPLVTQSTSSSSTGYTLPQQQPPPPPSSSSSVSPYGQPAPSGPSLTSHPQPYHTYSDHGVEPGYFPVPGHDNMPGPPTSFPAKDLTGAVPINQPHASARSNVPSEAEMAQAYADDDSSMADSDDDFGEVDGTRGDEYGILVQSRMDSSAAGFSTEMRTFSAFANHHVLTSYVPNAANSPLTDDRTAALFWHFVNVTGPSMSMYERHPSDHINAALNIQSAPQASHNIWTCELPNDPMCSSVSW